MQRRCCMKKCDHSNQNDLKRLVNYSSLVLCLVHWCAGVTGVVAGIAALPGVQPKRANVILAGAVVIRELMRAGGYKTPTMRQIHQTKPTIGRQSPKMGAESAPKPSLLQSEVRCHRRYMTHTDRSLHAAFCSGR